MRNKEGLKTLPISVLIGSCNEGHLLEDCLKSLQFCDEIVLVNLSSNDNTEAIALKYADQYIYVEERPLYFDMLHEKYVPNLKHEWFVLIDPDERISEELAQDIGEHLNQVTDDISVIRVPMINHFKGKQLKGTVYGGVIYARLLYKRSGVNVGVEVHSGIKMKEGFSRIKIHFKEQNFDSHLWCNSWSQLLDKHRRYLKGEGMAQYNMGVRYSFKKQYYDSLIRFYYSFKTRQGYKDGWTGFWLSFFAARYDFLKFRELRKYEKSLNK
ncbi:MAG: glycosyltransferase [Bacteroidia bacterium]|nr:glycosyltransferase [Bacteroidia bacterium]